MNSIEIPAFLLGFALGVVFVTGAVFTFKGIILGRRIRCRLCRLLGCEQTKNHLTIAFEADEKIPTRTKP